MRRHTRNGASPRVIAMMLIGGMLVTGFPSVALADETVAPEEIAVDGSYDFSSLGWVNDTWYHRTALSADGAHAAFRPTSLDPVYGDPIDDDLQLTDTVTGDRVLVSPSARACVAISGDGDTVVFSGSHEDAAPPVETTRWAYAFDAVEGTATPLPMPDLSFQGDAYHDSICPLAVDHAGDRVLFGLWDKLFLAELGSGDPVARHLMDGPAEHEFDAPFPARAVLSADGERMLLSSGSSSPWSDQHVGV